MAALVGRICAVIGVYVVLRRRAFIGDALAHTVLPGLVIAYLNQWSLVGGATVAGLATALLIGWLSQRQEVREDTAIGIVFTGMFALGILLMSTVRSFRDFSHILFGNILGVTPQDLRFIAGVAVVVLLLLALGAARPDRRQRDSSGGRGAHQRAADHHGGNGITVDPPPYTDDSRSRADRDWRRRGWAVCFLLCECLFGRGDCVDLYAGVCGGVADRPACVTPISELTQKQFSAILFPCLRINWLFSSKHGAAMQRC